MTDVAEHPALGAVDEAARAALFTAARTANTWADTPVGDEELRSIWELAKWPPTSANTQPLRVLYVRPGEGRERLARHMAEGNRAKTLAAPAVAVLAVDTRFHQHIPAVWPHNPAMRDAFEADAERRTAVGRLNAALQAGYFILAIRAHGLAAGPMAGFDAAGMDGEFFPDGRLASFLVVNIGHPGPDAWRDRLPRLDQDDVIGWA
jgi:3-hydroxypropanoate dehydrogenase